MSPEHDRFAWVSLNEAVARCQPEDVAWPFVAVAERLGLEHDRIDPTK